MTIMKICSICLLSVFTAEANLIRSLQQDKVGLKDAQMESMIEELSLRSCDIVVMEGNGNAGYKSQFAMAQTQLCQKLSCFYSNGEVDLHLASGLNQIYDI